MSRPGLPDLAPAFELVEHDRVELNHRPVGRPGPDQVLIEVAYSGVSAGTELLMATGKKAWLGGHAVLPGYQVVGRVVALGAQSTGRSVEEGDSVACFVFGSHHVTWSPIGR